jgi:hypothetical protein
MRDCRFERNSTVFSTVPVGYFRRRKIRSSTNDNCAVHQLRTRALINQPSIHVALASCIPPSRLDLDNSVVLVQPRSIQGQMHADTRRSSFVLHLSAHRPCRKIPILGPISTCPPRIPTTFVQFQCIRPPYSSTPPRPLPGSMFCLPSQCWQHQFDNAPAHCIFRYIYPTYLVSKDFCWSAMPS